MNTDQANYLNIGLMILSCAIAIVLPFELFLFSYAIIGPLHYLTEISWLHKRQYFTPGKKDYLLLALLTLLIAAPNMLNYFYELWGPKDADGKSIRTDEISSFITTGQNLNPMFVFVSFSVAAVLIFVKDFYRRLVAVILILIIGALIRTQHFVSVIFAIFVPTLVHVFLFTGAFILVGALKSKSRSGIISLGVFITCAVCLFIINPNGTGYTVSEFAQKNYDKSFISVNKQIFDTFLHKVNANSYLIYHSPAGIMITRFIAYAYTYHYLNWFSKTSIIKWHKVPKSSLAIVAGIWILSIILYISNYETGLMALYFLSFLHVIFEFPLNIQSFKQIGQEVRGRLKPARTTKVRA